LQGEEGEEKVREEYQNQIWRGSKWRWNCRRFSMDLFSHLLGREALHGRWRESSPLQSQFKWQHLPLCNTLNLILIFFSRLTWPIRESRVHSKCENFEMFG